MFLRQLSLIAVACQADIDGVRLRQTRLSAGMGIVAIGTIARCTGMLHLRLLNRVGLVGVASHAQILRVCLRQDNFSVFGGSMARVTRFICKRRMQELPHQLRRRRLMRIVALRAICLLKWLIVVRLLQCRIFHVVTIDAQRWSGFSQMKIKLRLPHFADFMRRVAGVTAHVERGVTAALRRNVQALRVAIETKVRALVSRSRFQQLVFVVALMGIVALDAIAHRRRMHRAFQRRRIFLRMAGQAHGLRRRGDQLYARDVFVDANFVAA